MFFGVPVAAVALGEACMLSHKCVLTSTPISGILHLRVEYHHVVCGHSLTLCVGSDF